VDGSSCRYWPAPRMSPDSNYEVLWIGTDFHRVLNPATVITPFATVPAGMLGQLRPRPHG